MLIIDYFKSGKTEMETHLLDGVATGTLRRFYENGNVRSLM
jgi:antitoxin component YwqK of YwqJK toxin-antitoxin module